MSAPYVNHEALVRELAPHAMPCFSDRLSWTEYLVSAAAEQRREHAAGPLLFRPGKPVVFDRTFRPCVDCTAQHAFAMVREGRCQPDFLLNLIPEPKEAADAAA